jgi:hypothetical protein
MHARKTIESLESASQARICRLPDVSLLEARARLRAALGAHGFAVLGEVDLAVVRNAPVPVTVVPAPGDR